MEKLTEGNFYHIYNRGINSEPLFLQDKDYFFFLERYEYYSYLSLQTFSFCLMNNHFHFVVRVRSNKEQEKLFQFYKVERNSEKYHGCNYDTFKVLSASRQLAHLFSTYTKKFNGWNQRTGKLFEQPFKRKRIDNRTYLRQLVCYIHRNPVHHKVTEDYCSYPYSSFQIFLKNSDSFLEKRKVLDLFGGLNLFKEAHANMGSNLTAAMQLES